MVLSSEIQGLDYGAPLLGLGKSIYYIHVVALKQGLMSSAQNLIVKAEWACFGSDLLTAKTQSQLGS